MSDERVSDNKSPKFSVGDRVKVLYEWANGGEATITDGAVWDDNWNCYSYVVNNGFFRLEEHELKADR